MLSTSTWYEYFSEEFCLVSLVWRGPHSFMPNWIALRPFMIWLPWASRQPPHGPKMKAGAHVQFITQLLLHRNRRGRALPFAHNNDGQNDGWSGTWHLELRHHLDLKLLAHLRVLFYSPTSFFRAHRHNYRNRSYGWQIWSAGAQVTRAASIMHGCRWSSWHFVFGALERIRHARI